MAIGESIRPWVINCAGLAGEGLPPGEAGLESVPERDVLLPALPAQVHELAVHVRVEVHEPAVRVLQLAPERVQLDRGLVQRLQVRRELLLERRPSRVLL